jgi:flagellar M-ring protein FliF
MADTLVLDPAAAPEPAKRSPLVERFRALPARAKLALAVGIPALIALLVVGLMQARGPSNYRVLFANLADADGGAIMAALEQQGVPYRISPSGDAILVPSERVHDTRLRLATQGLPRGGNVGFELMDRAPLGITQFQEQVNYQRALEGELARSIQALGAVQSARVHLAVPKPSIFVRERNQPTASILVRLQPGRALDAGQVAGIVHLVSSSVPELTIGNVSVVDQNGNLLSGPPRNQAGLDASQLEFVANLERQYVQRINDLLSPIVGANNLRAQVTLDMDFSHQERTHETFKPNTDPTQATIRSQQTSESVNPVPTNPAGVPGALANTPPGVAVAPVNGNAPTNPVAPGQQPPAPGFPAATQRSTITNYEVDKTVLYTKEPVGRLRRVSAAVVINHRTAPGENGQLQTTALSEEQLAQINRLVREAVGAREDRQDTISVVNMAFDSPAAEPTVPLWQQPAMQQLGKELLLYLLAAGIVLYLIFGVIRPAVKAVTTPPKPAEPELEPGMTAARRHQDGQDGQADEETVTISRSEQILEEARKMAAENPRIVAQVLKGWLASSDGQQQGA